MSRTSSFDIKLVATYCYEPRKISDICTQFSISSPQAHRTMNKLVWSNLVSERMIKGKGLQYKMFLRTELDSENAWERKESFKDAVPAHDPFGLTSVLALELLQKGVNVHSFSKKYTRKIRSLDTEPQRTRRNREEMSA